MKSEKKKGLLGMKSRQGVLNGLEQMGCIDTERNYLSSEQLNIAAVVSQTESEGPGSRYALWLQGCPQRCPGCCNPHMLSFRPALNRSVEDVLDEIERSEGIEGITLLGGEPFSQSTALSNLTRRVREMGLSVMVFSGWTLGQIKQSRDPNWSAFLRQIDVLVDGRYMQEKASSKRRWIGSSNQRVHFLTPFYRALQESPSGWDVGSNTIELRMKGGVLSVNGFPHPNVMSQLSTSFRDEFADPSNQEKVSPAVSSICRSRYPEK